MPPTPEQIEALNRAIAEYEGWEITDFPDRKLLLVTYKGDPGEGFDYSGLSSGGIDKAMFYAMSYLPNYTSDLKAIVEVVEYWCDHKSDEANESFILQYEEGNGFYAHVSYAEGQSMDSPALALCLAFAKAAGLKGWWE
jgi:hypothetical protein